MKVFSKETDVNQSSETYKKVSEHLGLSLENTKKIIDKQFQLTPEGDKGDFYKKIENYYLGTTETYGQEYYMNIFNDTLNDSGNKNKAFNNVVNELSNKSENTDTVNILSVIKDLLIMTNQGDKNKLSSLLSVADYDIDFHKLNESVDFQFNNDVKLNYNGLANLLSKNNKRWHISNKIETTHGQIQSYINTKISDMQSAEIVGYEPGADNKILMEYINGVISPLNKSYSSNKLLVNNIQAIVFDMTLAINSYMTRPDTVEKLGYIANDKLITYKKTAGTIIELLYSSIGESCLLNKHYVEDIINGKVDTGAGDYANNNTIIDDLTNSIGFNSVQMLKLNSVFSMLTYIHSASGDFNLKIRPALKMYINNLHAILTKLNRL